MRTLAVFLLIGVVCQGKPPHNPSLLDVLKPFSVAKTVNRLVARQGTGTSMPGWFGWNETTPDNTEHAPHHWIDEFSGLRDAFLFPGSKYLIRLIEHYIEDSTKEPMSVEEMKDYFELPECDMKDVFKKVVKVSRLLDTDPEGLALLATRILMKPILMERMKCPAAILDVGLTRSLMYVRHDFMEKDDESLYTFFRDMVPHLDAALEPYAEDIAERGVHEFHGFVFNETMEYILGFGLRDLAFASHRLFGELLEHFRYMTGYAGSSNSMEHELKYRIHNALWEIRCPGSYEVIENHERIIWRFREVFGRIETEHVCPKVIDFLHTYVNMTMPGIITHFENNISMDIVCEGLTEVIREIVEGVAEYEEALHSMSIPSLEEMLKDTLSSEEWELIAEALRRLGFMDMM